MREEIHLVLGDIDVDDEAVLSEEIPPDHARDGDRNPVLRSPFLLDVSSGYVRRCTLSISNGFRVPSLSSLR